MAESTDDVRRDIEVTRERMSDTIAELESRVSGRVHAVKERLDVVGWVREHPWSALALAVGAGLALSATGADRRAAGAVAAGAKTAAGSAKDAVGGAVTSVKERFAGEGEAEAALADHGAAEGEGWLGRLKNGISEAVKGQVGALIDDVRGPGGRRPGTPTMAPLETGVMQSGIPSEARS